MKRRPKECIVEINLPEIYEPIVQSEAERIVVFHAPLHTRIPQSILADFFNQTSSMVNRKVCFIAEKIAALKADLDYWLSHWMHEACRTNLKVKIKNNEYKFTPTNSSIYIFPHDYFTEGKIDMPFHQVHEMAIVDAHSFSFAAFKELESSVRYKIIVAGEHYTENHWMQSYIKDGRVFRFPGSVIARRFSDQQDRLELMKQKFGSLYAQRVELESFDDEEKIDAVNLVDWQRLLFPHYFTLRPSPMHTTIGKELIQIRNMKAARINIRGPRGNAKSVNVSFALPLYCICEELEQYIIITADTSEQANKYLEGIKDELVSNELIEKHYPNAFGKGAVWNVSEIVTSNGIRVEALGAGKKIRGRRYQEHRPGLIIVDDPEGDDSSFSNKIRGKIWDWLTKGVLKAGHPETNVIVTGTEVHRDCTVARLKRSPGWRDFGFRSIISWPTNMELWSQWGMILSDLSNPDAFETARKFYDDNKEKMDEGSEVLWPELETLYELMLIREREGENAFEAEKQNNPVDLSKIEWPPELFDDLWFQTFPENPYVKVMSCDPSKADNSQESGEGDYQSICCLAVHQSIIYIEVLMGRWGIGGANGNGSKSGMLEVLLGKMADFKPDVVVIEENQFQALIIPCLEEMSPCAPIEGIEHHGVRKQTRIRRLNPFVVRRRMRFRNTPGTHLCIEQFKDLFTGEHDDGPDSVEMAMRKAMDLMWDRVHEDETNELKVSHFEF